MNTHSRKRKHDKFYDQGYGYTFNSTRKHWDFFYCDHRESGCPISAKYYRNLGTFEVSLIQGPHNHDPENYAMLAHQLMMRIYEKAGELRLLDPRKIVETELATVPAEVLRLIPPKDHIYRAIRKIKRKKGYVVEDPKSIAEIDTATLEKLVSIDQEKLLYADTGVIDGTRSLIFTTPSLLDVFLRSKGIASDATFESKVQHFSQVWTIHAFIRDHVAVPVITCLMSSKTERAYIEVLRRLPEHPSLEKYYSDYERSEFNALAWKFPNAKHEGCLAHFARNVIQHFREAGYTKKEYKGNPFLRLSLRRILCLPFSDQANVFHIYQEFKQNMIQTMPLDRRLDAFFMYLERTWVGYLDDRHNYHPPKFEYQHWIFWNGAKYPADKTTNIAEAWNKLFNQSTGKDPTLSRFLEAWHSEIAMIKKKLAEESTKVPPLPEDKEIELAVHSRNWGIISVFEYFDRIAVILHGIDFNYMSQ